AVARDDSGPGAHWALGLVSFYLRKHGRAVREAERAIVRNPNFAEGQVSLGEALIDSGRSGEARAYFDRASVLNPYFPDI
ncbi:tetratricopeptide repeat protein, partial [Rhizobium ruizarguesonis]